MTPNSSRESFAAGANITAIICAALSFLTFAVAIAQIFGHRTPSVSSFMVAVFTLPVAIVCTIIALVLVGARQSKLAWISLGIFLLQFILGFAVMEYLTHQ
jgi:hypothetical protein